jgi:hypothetical protein
MESVQRDCSCDHQGHLCAHQIRLEEAANAHRHLGISQDGKPGSDEAKQHNHSVEEGLRGNQQIAVAMQSSASEWGQLMVNKLGFGILLCFVQHRGK